MAPEIFSTPLSSDTVQRLADETFGDMVKFVVDLEQRIICAGGGLHSDEEEVLLQAGSRQENLWGGNYFPGSPAEARLEYTSMINVRTAQHNPSQEIQSPTVKEQVRLLALHFFEAKPL